MSFSLTKWYFDVTTPDGGVAIAYCVEVHWGPLRQPFSGVLMFPARETPNPWTFSTATTSAFHVDGNSLRWGSTPLDLNVEFERRAPGFEHRLYNGADGVIDWRCEMPRADVRVRVGDKMLEGVGYAERIEMTLLPWKIPADEIRWGRFIADGSTIVWIDWRGEQPQSLVFLDGRAMPVTMISDTTIRFGDGCELQLEIDHVVSDDMLGGLLAPLEMLRPLVEPIMRTRQTRWISNGELHGVASAPQKGWAIHEVVRRR